ncbi:MAG: lipoyl synthase [Acidimicrobiia bacterium]
MTSTLRVRWLGRVSYADADALQRGLHEHGNDDHLLLLEHPHVYTLGTTSHVEHVLTPPASVGADLVRTDRGGDVTYHGPGQLVGYPIVTLPEWRDGLRDVVAYVRRLEDLLIAALADIGVAAERRERLTGVWVGDEKIAAIGVKVARGRTRHGFALNVDPDLAMFDHIVPCGIRDKGVTSLRRLLGADAPMMAAVVDVVAERFAEVFGYPEVDRQDVSHGFGVDSCRRATLSDAKKSPGIRLLGRLADAGVEVPDPDPAFRRPEWMRVRADLGPGYRQTKRIMRSLDLRTVCEEAGCPNIYECWAERTATFMILGERCTRACGFCLVDTRKPLPFDDAEPSRVADAVATLGLRHAVVTSVARDDLPDGGAGGFAATIRAVRARTPDTTIEVLVPDCKGDPAALDAIFAARPDVLNHNLETVARLQRAARPSAGYARSLALLARAKDAGLVTKSGLILGMGEEEHEVRGALADLRSVGVDIVTMGQYLRPSAQHLPVVRWWHPEEFAALHDAATALGFVHVEAGPLVRSSYHAKRAADATAPTPTGAAVSA